jgi:hypothetical protein
MTSLGRIFVMLLVSLALTMTACSGSEDSGPAQAAPGGGGAPASAAEERVLRAGLPFLFTNQPPDPAEGGRISSDSDWAR